MEAAHLNDIIHNMYKGRPMCMHTQELTHMHTYFLFLIPYHYFLAGVIVSQGVYYYEYICVVC